MAISTYSELQSAIGDWLNRSDLAAVVPNFIALAEANFNRQIRTRQMVKRATAQVEDGFTTLPTDFLEAKNVQLNTSPIRALTYVTLDAADGIRAGAATGMPAHYTIVGTAIELVPYPSGTYELELAYYGRIPALSSVQTINWLLTDHPDVYLHGALMQSAPYLRDDERIATWGSVYQAALRDLKLADDKSAVSGSPLISRAPVF